ncbi:MAG: S41 family peptidase [Roseivirga sp.]|nr:S41 family peptidase [Roseivirga sp.]
MNFSKHHRANRTRFGGLLLTIGFYLCLGQSLLYGQGIKPVDIKKIDKRAVIEATAKLLKDHYLYEEVGGMMGDLLKKRLAEGDYDQLKTTTDFARAITVDLQSNFRDKHIKLSYDPRTIKMTRNASGEDKSGQSKADLIEELLAVEIYENYRIPEIRRIRGNIGYLKMDMMLPPVLATGYSEKMAAAMELLADTDALILDLRHNPGGWAEGNRLLMSYFFPARTHIMNSTSRLNGETNKTKEFTRDEVSGRQMLEQPLYVLVSSKTASAAESASHILKYGGRAKLIGETTYGAGYSFDDMFVDENFIIAMPNSTGMHPKATENWESIGLKPDVVVSQSQAMEEARLLAVIELLEKELAKPRKERYKYRVDQLTWEKDRLNDLKTPLVLTDEDLLKYTGDYGPRKISLENGHLYHKNTKPNRPAYKLIPIRKDEFLLEGLEDYRLYFDRDKKGEIKQVRMRSLTRLYIEQKQ